MNSCKQEWSGETGCKKVIGFGEGGGEKEIIVLKFCDGSVSNRLFYNQGLLECSHWPMGEAFVPSHWTLEVNF